MEVRLQKYMATCGIASRRHSEEIIAAGRVRVNGSVVTEQGTRIDPVTDVVLVDGKKIEAPTTFSYYMFHKPAGYLTTVTDPQGRPTIYDLLPDLRGKVVPVGRLDMDTEGLLFLTDDGEFAHRLTHPKYGVKKTYVARVDGRMTEPALHRLATGVQLDDGMTQPAEVRVLKAGQRHTTVELIIREGKKRQVRRMFEAVGFPVLSLRRTAIDRIRLSHVDSGEVRPLNEDEITRLCNRLQLHRSFS